MPAEHLMKPAFPVIYQHDKLRYVHSIHVVTNVGGSEYVMYGLFEAQDRRQNGSFANADACELVNEDGPLISISPFGRILY